MKVFEYGAGASTLWWAQRVSEVLSCEHDPQWFELTRKGVPSNAKIVHAPRDNYLYANRILEHVNEFDIVVIDGRDRVRCARNSINALTQQGVVIWDNSDRDYYKPGFEFLQQHGFRRIDFFGMSPLVAYESATAVLYREHNCLGL
jgi:predicted O-methyltransferase YrrM